MYDNAFAESLFASIKSELLPANGIFESKSEAATSIFDYLECFYNRRLLHSALGYVTAKLPNSLLPKPTTPTKLKLRQLRSRSPFFRGKTKGWIESPRYLNMEALREQRKADRQLTAMTV